MNKHRFYLIIFLLLTGLLGNCVREGNQQDSTEEMSSPVTIESTVPGSISDYIQFTAVSMYLQKEIVRSPTTGFIEKLEKQIGQRVNSGETILRIRTKEASAIHIPSGDSSMFFSGLITITPSGSGIISQIDHQQGDYVSEADPLVVISQPESLVFLVKVPFAYRSYIVIGKEYEINLPDRTHIRGTVLRSLPSVDPQIQTQDYIIKPLSKQGIPENLNVLVTIVMQTRSNYPILHKSCILTNETQTEFWVMKLINDTMAVKVPIHKGIETDSLVEVISPDFDKTARFISSGSYGLPDTARIKIMLSQE